MTSPRQPSERTARGNRVGLAVVGMALVAAGAAALAAAPGPVLTAGEGRLGDWWWAVGAGAASIVAVCLRWLAVQLRRDAFGSFHLEDDPVGGTTRLPAGVLAAAVQREVAAGPGVARASALFAGRASAPELRLRIGLEEGADLAAVRAVIDGEIVPHACEALGIAALPVHVAVALDVSRARRAPTVIAL